MLKRIVPGRKQGSWGIEIRDVRRDGGERMERVMLSTSIEPEVRVSMWWRVSRSEDLPLWVLVVVLRCDWNQMFDMFWTFNILWISDLV